MIGREAHARAIEQRLKQFPVVAILGARQVGKTTLAHGIAARHQGESHWFDLESPPDLARMSDPHLTLEGLRGLIILDEVQRLPNVFEVLRVLADHRPRRSRFLVLGSAGPELLQQSSESLAGRISYVVLPGLGLSEVGPDYLSRLWLRGGFPLSYLARSNRESLLWRDSFVDTFLSRELPQLGISVSSVTMRRFWTMLAHWHAQIWNASEFSRSFGVSDVTVRRYLDLLTSALVARQLQPWFANVGKRQVKSPKVYVRDSGLLHALLKLERMSDLEAHPKLGASWEGFLVDQIATHFGLSDDELHFWATHTGAELDLFVRTGRRRLGFEFKRTSSPSLTRSMKSAIEALDLHQLHVIHAGKQTFPLAKKVRAVAASRLVEDL